WPVDSGRKCCDTPVVKRRGGVIDRGRGAHKGLLALTTLVAAALSACSPGGSRARASAQNSAGPASTSASCHWPSSTRSVVAAPVAGTPSAWNVPPFDGPPTRVHWFPAG